MADRPPRLVCFACGKPVKRDGHGTTWDAVVFRSPGNFGSRLIDCNGFDVELVVHDGCIRERIKRVGTATKHTPRPIYTYGRARLTKRGGIRAVFRKRAGEARVGRVA